MPPSLGSTGIEIWHAWQAASTNLMHRTVVEARDVHTGLTFAWGPNSCNRFQAENRGRVWHPLELRVTHKERTARGWLAFERTATEREIQACSDAVDKGTLQIE